MGKGKNSNNGLEEMQKQIDKLKKEKELEEAKQGLDNVKKAQIPTELSELEKEKQTIEAKKNILKAIMPDVEAKALEGKMTTDANVTTECQILTYKALSEVAVQIGKTLTTKGAANLVICDQNDFDLLNIYTTFLEQINLLKKEYTSALVEGPVLKKAIMKMDIDKFKTDELSIMESKATQFMPAGNALVAALNAPAMAATAVKSVVDLIALLRTDTELKGNKFDITNEALIAEIARTLKMQKQAKVDMKEVKLIYPAFVNAAQSQLLKCVIELTGLKENADKKIAAQTNNVQSNEKISFS